MKSLFMLVALAAAHAQTPTFEVASIKPSPPDHESSVSSRGGPGTRTPTTWTCQNMSLHNIVWIAFNLRSNQLIAPEWMNDTRFDVTARIPEGTTREQFYQMFQNLLTERFGLKFHRDQKEVQGYQLVLAKNGPKFQESGSEPAKETPPPDGYPALRPGITGMSIRSNRAHAQWLRMSIQKFATDLDYRVEKPVVDATGLNGTYDLYLYWVADPMRADADGPSIFAALQDQLGLKLEPRKVTLPIVIIDHAEKRPTEN
jgi:uncharacterized protein (TIGR03435 family)